MNEKEEFFSLKHKRLLNIATWAKYLAWTVLVVYVLWSIASFINYSTAFYLPSMASGEYVKNLFQSWDGNPIFVINALLAVANTLLQGITAFVILKAVSLGLNIIVETDINYREQKQQEGSQ